METFKKKICLIDRNRLHLESIVGKGNFGNVYKALLNNPNSSYVLEVAVKTFKNGILYILNVIKINLINILYFIIRK